MGQNYPNFNILPGQPHNFGHSSAILASIPTNVGPNLIYSTSTIDLDTFCNDSATSLGNIERSLSFGKAISLEFRYRMTASIITTHFIYSLYLRGAATSLFQYHLSPDLITYDTYLQLTYFI